MGRHEMGVYDSVFLTDGDSESPVLPIYLEFIYRVKEAAADYAEECRLNGQSTPKPTALVLDELRAMPVPQIERILTDCRERGIIVVGGIQSLKQAEDLYGDAGKDFLSAWRCALVFRGILDRDTLELISFLSGTYWEEVKGYSEHGIPRRTLGMVVVDLALKSNHVSSPSRSAWAIRHGLTVRSWCGETSITAGSTRSPITVATRGPRSRQQRRTCSKRWPRSPVAATRERWQLRLSSSARPRSTIP